MGPWGPPPKLSPGDAVKEVPVPKATVISSKSLLFFFGSRRKFFRVLSFHSPPPGNSRWVPPPWRLPGCGLVKPIVCQASFLFCFFLSFVGLFFCPTPKFPFDFLFFCVSFYFFIVIPPPVQRPAGNYLPWRLPVSGCHQHFVPKTAFVSQPFCREA